MTAVPAYAGVPLTTRTSREVDRRQRVADTTVDWSAYTETQTLVLLAAGRASRRPLRAWSPQAASADTPVAMTSVGTTTEQQTVVSTLGRHRRPTRPPPHRPSRPSRSSARWSTMRDALSWFETKPLFGWRVLVPRTKEQAGSLSATLRGFGAVPEEVPTISVEPPRNPHQMDKAVRGLVEGRYEWIVFTSVNAVKAVREKFDEYGLDARAFSGLKVAAVGDKTAESLAGWGIRADLVPSGEQSARGLLEDWPPYDDLLDPINRVFLPRADIATETLVAGLHELGWEVDDVTAYRTVRAAPPPAPTRDAIKTGKFDAVVFTSSSTVRNLVGIAGKPHASTVIAAHRAGHREDVRGARPAGRRARAEALGRGAGRGAGRLRRGAPAVRCSRPVSRSRKPSERRLAEPATGEPERWAFPVDAPASAALVGGDAAAGGRDLAGAAAARPAAVRRRGAGRAGARSRRCRASCSTRASRCARPPPRRPRPVSAA